MDILLEDIGKLDWVGELLKPAVMLVKFINNHSSSLAIFRSHSDLELLRPVVPSLLPELQCMPTTILFLLLSPVVIDWT